MLALLYIVLCFAVGYAASRKGRSGVAWFLLSIFLSPLVGIIVVAMISSQAPAYVSLESQVRDSILDARYSPYIRSHKLPFGGSVVHDVTFFGEERRFQSKADAIAYCMMHLPQELPSTPAPALRSE